MKNRIISLVIALTLIAGMIPAVVASAEEASAPEIISQNIEYGGYFGLMYAVDASTVKGGKVTVTVYDADMNEVGSYVQTKTEDITTANGNTVTQLLVNPQFVDHVIDGGVGMVAMMYFKNGEMSVGFETYSAVHEKYFLAENQFTFTLDGKEVKQDPTVVFSQTFDTGSVNTGGSESDCAAANGFFLGDTKDSLYNLDNNTLKYTQVIAEIIFIQHHETESGTVEIIIAGIHFHGAEHGLIRIDVEFMVAEDKITGDLEFQILADQFGRGGRFVGEIAKMQQEFRTAFDGARLNGGQPLRRLGLIPGRMVVKVGKYGESDFAHGWDLLLAYLLLTDVFLIRELMDFPSCQLERSSPAAAKARNSFSEMPLRFFFRTGSHSIRAGIKPHSANIS